MIQVSIIIVNYNTYKELKNCVDSIQSQTTGVDYEIIIVDNASSCDVVNNIKQNIKGCNVIFLQTNVGFGRANNHGISFAQGKYVFLLNSDTILLNNAVKIFYDKMERMSSSVACLGTYLRDENGSYSSSYGRIPTILSCYYEFCFGTILRKMGFTYTTFDYKLTNKESAVEFIIGADMFVRKSIGEKCGFFDPRYFLYYEETDMQRHYFNNGFYSYIIEGPQIIHLVGKSANVNTYAKKMLRPMISHFIYLKKWYSLPVYYIYKLFFVLMNSIYYLLAKGNKKELYEVYLKSAFS